MISTFSYRVKRTTLRSRAHGVSHSGSTTTAGTFAIVVYDMVLISTASGQLTFALTRKGGQGTMCYATVPCWSLQVYLVEEDQANRRARKKAGGNCGKRYTEGWVEFEDKTIARGA